MDHTDRHREEGVPGRTPPPAERAIDLALLVGGDQGLSVIGSFQVAHAALKTIGRHAPDVALVDIALPGASGVAGIRLLGGRAPELAFLMFSLGEQDVGAAQELRADPACGWGGAPRRHPLDTLRDAVEGGSPLSSDMARRAIALLGRLRSTEPPDDDLTAHETRLLRMLVEGHTYRTIARELSVSVNTVAFHIKRVYEKLGVHSKSQAVAKALRLGLLR